jgi:hypothetical protein
MMGITAITLTKAAPRLGEGITADHVEALLKELPIDGTPRAVTLDLCPCRHVGPGAGWRLGNAISAWAAAGEVKVRVPDPGDFSGSWFLNFTRSGLGLALARHAEEIKSPVGDVSRALREYYAERGRLNSENYAVELDLVQSPLGIGIDAFAHEAKKLTPFVHLDLESLNRVTRQGFLEACFEAIENVGDHSFRSPWHEVARPLSYFSLSFHKTIASGNAPGAIPRGYLERVPEQVPGNRDRLGYVELIVTDNGCGIAQRHSLNPDIHAGPIEEEDRVLIAAFKKGETVKLRAGDSFVRGKSGYGFSYIVRGLRRLRAYATIRTGRRVAILDGSLPAEDAVWKLDGEPLAAIPGTTLQMLFPVMSSQLNLPLADES